MSIVDRIREEGKKRGMTIASIERSTDISNGTIRRWDISMPSADSLYKIAILLGCSIEYLITGKNAEHDILSKAELEWLNLYTQLSELDASSRDECIGFVKGYIACGTPKKNKP